MATARELPLRAVALVGLVLLAYNYSLLTLARGLTLQTPLAYLALVPVMALALAAFRVRLEPRGLPIHDRQLDWIVGLGLLGATAAILILLPDSTSSTFWLRRIDLLTLPLFVAGLIALLFGVRRAWSLKAPIAFLLLAWPVPYSLFLAGVSGQFTEAMVRLAGWFTQIVPVARPSVGNDSLFIVGSGPNGFGVSIGSACSGVNSFVGFLLLGTALLYLVRGPLVRRAIWLAVGLALVLALNFVRIAAILVVGATFGQTAALEILHPVAGLIVFSIGVIGMVAAVPRFGLRFVGDAGPDRPAGPGQATPVRRARPALMVALGVTVLLAITNATYTRFDAISSGLADARLRSFDARTATVPEWDSRFVVALPSAKQYFGDSATWDRALWWPSDGAPLYSSSSVYVDALTTDDPGALTAYGLEACYRFHGYEVVSVATADVGAGVQAQVIDYYNTKVKADWSALWWEWPYSENGATRYERVVILMSEGPKSEFKGVTAGDIGTQDARFAQSDKFLVTLAREIVASQLATASLP